MAKKLSAFVNRIVSFYTGPLKRNTIEYWQQYIFTIMSLAGAIAGTAAALTSAFVVLRKGQYIGAAVLLVLYSINIFVIFLPKLTLKFKAFVIAFIFYLIGVASLILAGPVGESGIFFTVSVLLCSMYLGLKISVIVALLNLATGITFGLLHFNGIIGWELIKDFPLRSWLLQSSNIFMMDLMFVFAITTFIRGVGNNFKSLKKAEARTHAALQEKDTLIRELYHRSKNNMQVVSSLLRLHSAELEDAVSKAVFKDIVNKIIAMSLVHQKLYESRDLSNINMADYIRDLVGPLVRSYGLEENVELIYRLDEVSMPIDTAIPCGLVISEIVANSCKYAFPENRSGYIEILLSSLPKDRIELILRDNGIGTREAFEPSKQGKMGMKTLFTIISHQLLGSVEYSTDGGFSYTIKFDRILYSEEAALNG